MLQVSPSPIVALNRAVAVGVAHGPAAGLLALDILAAEPAQPIGKVLVTHGPYLEAKEHVGGFWILEVRDEDEALAWHRKAIVARRPPVEVRPSLKCQRNELWKIS